MAERKIPVDEFISFQPNILLWDNMERQYHTVMDINNDHSIRMVANGSFPNGWMYFWERARNFFTSKMNLETGNDHPRFEVVIND